MRFEIFLAIRYLRTPPRHALARLTALAAVLGIAFGVAAVIFAQSLANGFQQTMQNKILASTAHITVFSVDGADISDWQNLRRQIEQIKTVKTVTAASFDNALLVGNTNSAFAVLRGVQIPDLDNPQSTIHNPQSTIQIEIGRDLAQKTGLQVGDTAQIVSGGETNFAGAVAPVATAVEVADIFSTGLYEYDSTWIRTDLATAAKIAGKPQLTVSALEIQTNDLYNSPRIAKLIEEKVGAGYRVLDWQEANRPLFTALSLERRVGIATVFLIVLAAVLNITTTLALVVEERKSDIAVLKTCGARARSIVFIFLMEGALLGAVGILLGAALGVSACLASNYFGLVNLPPDVYSISRITIEPTPSEILLTIMVTFLLCLTASSFPALVAARVKPIVNLN